MKINLAYSLTKKDFFSLLILVLCVVLVFSLHGVDYQPGVNKKCEGCSVDIGPMDRGGHYEKMLWNGVRDVHDSGNENLMQFTKSNRVLNSGDGTIKNCIDCHNDTAGATVPSLGDLWVKFPRLDKASGRIIDFEKAVQYEFVNRYGGTKPFYNDVRITQIMVYAYEKAKQKKLVFDVEPDDGTPISDEQLEKLNTSSTCWDVFSKYGKPKGEIAPYIVKGCNIFTRTTDNRPAGYKWFWKTDMNCTSCHLEGGTKEYAAHMADAVVNYPNVYSHSNIVYTNRMRIARCYAHSINEILYGSNSEVYKLITLYLTWIAEKNQLPIGTGRESRGIHNVRGTAANHGSIIAGQKAYNKQCLECHGPAGYGSDKFKDNPDFSPPPINGSESFVRTATLSYSSRFASFIMNNMPPGATHEHPTLTAQQALDIAEFIRVQTRPSAPEASNMDVFYNYISNKIMNWWFSGSTSDVNS